MADLSTAILEKSDDFKVGHLQVVRALIEDFNKTGLPSPASSHAGAKITFETTKLEDTNLHSLNSHSKHWGIASGCNVCGASATEASLRM
eukprot:15464074-Alexandrium_andersonii.AAC.1